MTEALHRSAARIVDESGGACLVTVTLRQGTYTWVGGPKIEGAASWLSTYVDAGALPGCAQQGGWMADSRTEAERRDKE